MENLKNFMMGRLNAIDMLEDIEDKKALYNQVFGACEFYAHYGKKHEEIAKRIWEDFSWEYLKLIHK